VPLASGKDKTFSVGLQVCTTADGEYQARRCVVSEGKHPEFHLDGEVLYLRPNGAAEGERRRYISSWRAAGRNTLVSGLKPWFQQSLLWFTSLKAVVNIHASSSCVEASAESLDRSPPQPHPVVLNGEEFYQAEDVHVRSWLSDQLWYKFKWVGYPEEELMWQEENQLRQDCEELDNFVSVYRDARGLPEGLNKRTVPTMRRSAANGVSSLCGQSALGVGRVQQGCWTRSAADSGTMDQSWLQQIVTVMHLAA
jgi:hypothetical protein